MAKINDHSLPLFFHLSLTGPTSQPHKPGPIKSQSREGYTWQLGIQYGNTIQRQGIVLVKWCFKKQAILYQNYTNFYQVTWLQSKVSRVGVRGREDQKLYLEVLN